MRRLPTALEATPVLMAVGAVVALAVLLALSAGPGAPPAGAAAAQLPPHVDVIEVVGLVDPIQLDFVADALGDAEKGGAKALVIQVDSGGGVASEEDVDVLAFRIAHSSVPVAVWVGPSGSRAFGQAFELVKAAPISGMTTKGRVGDDGRKLESAEALKEKVVDISAPTLGDFIVELDGRRVGGTTLVTAEVVRDPGEDPRRRPTVEVRFAKLGLLPRLLHSAASPSVAYLFLVVGLALVILELYTAGIGAAALTGAACLVLASYGLGTLPTRPAAVVLILLGMLGYAIDIQAGSPRAWTVIGTAALAGGSLWLYEDGLAPSPLVLVIVVVGIGFLMVSGLPAMVRSRFSTPTVGRESMVGELGTALAAVDPEGTVEIRGAPWRARTNRSTPIGAGENVRVVGIDGLLLEVEPEAGGAKDYRH
ncbi:MAG TPA: NfeD family protein [Acidimicrobiales bacterium]|nr:NfeD family protein [Acidimicrobiales bacterium]